ncbi:hypothetical protein, partial [Photorhabdus sp. RM96S]|uniref:hypothetical protein n=1 Tax=Photorhabdus sp. RM96S TaxID=3342822 RepID=UPI0036DE26AD
MPIIRIKPLINAQAVARAHRRSADNSPALCSIGVGRPGPAQRGRRGLRRLTTIYPRVRRG